MDSSEPTEQHTENPRNSRTAQVLNAVHRCYNTNEESAGVTEDDLVKRAEQLLKSKAEEGDTHASLLLGHLYYAEGHYTEAEAVFDGIKDREPEALYQLAVMYYDGHGTTEDQSKAMVYMKRVAEWDTGNIRYAALYNLGRAYLQGYGVQASSEEAEKYWLIAADDGNPNASVEAQASLGLFYSSPETRDLKKAFYWHSQASGNGNLESQGALGIMYLNGCGVSQDLSAALYCLTEAAERGNVYAQGHLVAHYYQNKLYTRAADLAERVCEHEDISAIANSTACDPEYICRGITIAMFYLARCLQLGLGVTQDTEKAQHYYTKLSFILVKLDPELVAETYPSSY